MSSIPYNLTVLISGGGTNLQALIDACGTEKLPNTRITHVISNRKDVKGLQRAADASIPTTYHNLVGYKKRHPKDNDGVTAARKEFDADLAKIILETEPKPDVIVCAGWMHIFTASFLAPINAQNIRIINLHPALPGEFPGARAIEDAYEEGQTGNLKRTGIMIHELIEDLDAGDAIVTEEVEFREGEDLEGLKDRMHAVEHRLIVEGTRRVLEGIKR